MVAGGLFVQERPALAIPGCTVYAYIPRPERPSYAFSGNWPRGPGEISCNGARITLTLSVALVGVENGQPFARVCANCPALHESAYGVIPLCETGAVGARTAAEGKSSGNGITEGPEARGSGADAKISPPYTYLCHTTGG